MKINVHAGHNPDGKTACGAIGLIKESTENRKVKNEVISLLKTLGHTVYDCTEDNGKSKSDVLKKIVTKCNAHKVDLDVSIHFNAGGGRGTEVLIYGTNSGAYTYAKNTADAISTLGFVNRGVKNRPDLYVLKHTNAPAMLIESCFVASAEDVTRYNCKTMAQAIVKGITGQTINNTPVQSNSIYKVQVGAFSKKENADALAKELNAKGYKTVIVSESK